jgi:hypothetical protein
MLPAPFTHACFVSFAQLDKDTDLKPFQTFLDELKRAFLQKGLRNERNETYFLINDKHSGDFRSHLSQGKQGSVCLLSLYSPNYWDSSECSDERNTFIGRDLPARYHLDHYVRHSDMFAVPWIHRSVEGDRMSEGRIYAPGVSEAVRRLAYFREEAQFPSVYRDGLLASLQEPATEEEAKRYIAALADRMSAFIERVRVAPSPAAKVARRGKLYVLAAKPDEVEKAVEQITCPSDIRSLRVKSYRMGGGPDWHPFSPENRDCSIGRLVSNIFDKHVDQLDMPSAPELPLATVIREAERRREYVIVVVDPWSIYHFEHLKSTLERLDEQNFANCMVLVVHGGQDEIYQVHADQIGATVEELFMRAKQNRLVTFCEVTNQMELEKTVCDLLDHLRQAMHKSASTAVRKVDLSGPRTPLSLANTARI